MLALLTVLALIPTAHPADRADDWILTVDRASAGPVITRRLAVQQHVDIPTADWPAMRTAAATSLAQLDAWFASYSGGAWNTWWLTFGTAQREAARQTILLGQ